ncbi:MAG TPA: MFS transporter [Hyphomonadaceae bacterium]|nr:MFS transporter [Hyphomonadaceae bacterium]
MTAVSARAYTAGDAARWGALALVFGAAMLNYLDRQALSLLKQDLQAQFRWSESDYAHINSGFQLATIATMLAVGWLVDRVGLRAGYAFGVGGWSLAQMAHTVVTTVGGFFAVRLALGATEAMNLPAAVKTVATWFRRDDRSLALGVMNLAPNVGAVIAPFVVLSIAATYGWTSAFIATGIAGFAWLALWLLLPRPAQQVEDEAPEGRWSIGRFLALAQDRRFWAITAGKFLSDFVWVFLLFWGPDLLQKTFNLDKTSMQAPVALVYVMAGIGSLFAGTLSSMLLSAGRSFNLARKTPMMIAALLAVPVFLVTTAGNVWIGAGLLGLTLAGHQMFSTSMFGLATDIFPSRMTGLVIGFAATLAGFSGLFINEFAGWVLDRSGSYLPVLAICAGAKIVAVFVVHLLVPDIDRSRESMMADAA